MSEGIIYALIIVSLFIIGFIMNIINENMILKHNKKREQKRAITKQKIAANNKEYEILSNICVNKEV